MVGDMSHPSVSRLGPPPRDVPLLLRLQLTFGGPLNQAGWGLFGFGMIFFWGFVMNCEFISWFTFSGEKATTQAVVTGSSETSMSENHRRIHAIEYWYPSVNVAEGHEGPVVLPKSADEIAQGHRGRSYSTVQSLPAGTQVTVEYLLRDPSISCIQGMRCRGFGAAVAFVVLFPFVGLCLLVPGFLRGRKACWLLASGNLGEAQLQSREATNVRVNNQTVFRFTFQFQATDGLSHAVVVKTHETEKVGDEATEKVIYDPFNPDCAVVLDALPGSFVVDEQGLIQTASPRAAIVALIIPSLTIVGHGLYLLLR